VDKGESDGESDNEGEDEDADESEDVNDTESESANVSDPSVGRLKYQDSTVEAEL
jgi:hypothetical protein